MKPYLACGTLVAAMLVIAGPATLGAEEGRSPFAPPTAPAAKAPPAAKEAPAPAAKGPSPGRTIRGHLTPPDRVTSALLWERSMDLKIPITVDPKTGAFEATSLKMGTYCLIVRTPWGRLEGIDMGPKVSDYDALIPPEYRTEDLGKASEGTLSDDDRKDVRRIIFEVKHYENKIRDIYLTGSADKAVALMELIQDQDFVGRKGDEITWRIEQWYYEKKYETWTTFRTRVLYRFRISKAVWETWGWQFEPALGGFEITVDRKEPVTVDFTIPEKPVPEKGLTGKQWPPAEKGIPKEPPPPADSP